MMCCHQPQEVGGEKAQTLKKKKNQENLVLNPLPQILDFENFHIQAMKAESYKYKAYEEKSRDPKSEEF